MSSELVSQDRLMGALKYRCMRGCFPYDQEVIDKLVEESMAVLTDSAGYQLTEEGFQQMVDYYSMMQVANWRPCSSEEKERPIY